MLVKFINFPLKQEFIFEVTTGSRGSFGSRRCGGLSSGGGGGGFSMLVLVVTVLAVVVFVTTTSTTTTTPPTGNKFELII
jgi:hypothetical protein